MKMDKKEYFSKCPVCLKKHSQQIFKNAMWHCELCGILCYSPEYRNEINKLLIPNKNREIFITFVREQAKEKPFVEISPKIIRQVLEEKGIII